MHGAALELLELSYTAAFGDLELTLKERSKAWQVLTLPPPTRRSRHKRGRRHKHKGGSGGGGDGAEGAAAAAAASGAAVTKSSPSSTPLGVLPQVRMDVARAMHWDVCQGWEESQRSKALAALTRMLGKVFPASQEHAFPFYVQGCHDVGGVLLLTLGEERGEGALKALLRGPLKGAVLQNMDVPCALLALLPALIAVGSGEVSSALRAVSPHEDALPHYALPWLLTWFSHSISSLSATQRLFDTFLMGHPLLPLYVAAALVTLPRGAPLLLDRLKEAVGDEGMAFQALSALPEDRLGSCEAITHVLRHANTIYATLPPLDLLEGGGGGERRGGASSGAATQQPPQPLAVLKAHWPELWEWNPPGGTDPRNPGGRSALKSAAKAYPFNSSSSSSKGLWGVSGNALFWGVALGVVVVAIGVAWARGSKES